MTTTFTGALGTLGSIPGSMVPAGTGVPLSLAGSGSCTILDVLKNAHLAPLIPVARIWVGDDLTQVDDTTDDGDGFDTDTGYLLDISGRYYASGTSKRAKLSGTPVQLGYKACTVEMVASQTIEPAQANVSLIMPTDVSILSAKRGLLVEYGYMCQGVARYDQLFVGIIVRDSDQHWPRTENLLALGRCRVLNKRAGQRHTYHGVDDATLMGNLANVVNLQSNHYDFDGDFAETYGTRDRPVTLAQGEAPSRLMSDFNRLGWRIYDTRMGTVLRREVSFSPDTGSTRFYYVAGDTIASDEFPALSGGALDRTTEGRKNFAYVFGPIPDDKTLQRPYQAYHDSTGVGIGEIMEKDEGDDSYSSDLWRTDTACDKAAMHKMNLDNRYRQILTVRAALNPYIQPNDSFAFRNQQIKDLDSGKAAIATRIRHEFSEGKGTTVMSGDMEYTPDLGIAEDLRPFAQLVATVSGPVDGYYTVDADATGSLDDNTPTDMLRFDFYCNRSSDGGPSRGVGTIAMKVPQGPMEANEVVIGVRVTNQFGLWSVTSFPVSP